MSEKYMVNVGLDQRSYPIYIQRNSLKKWVEKLEEHVKGRQCLIISDSNVYAIYADKIIQTLSDAGAILYASVFPAGEHSKCMDRLGKLYHKVASAGIGRDAIIIALGGGVTGDLAGFLAATWMRGIDFIQVPTTLLAMVDSSVGGKTGIDLPEGKNLVGAFWQPKCVLIDPDFLKTLPERERIGALAEVIKYGVIYDHRFFALLEKNVEKLKSFDLDFVTDLITRSCQIKAEVVEADEEETKGIRDILNFGHTFGHAIEKATQFETYSHGEAVAIGMCFACQLARQLEMLDPSEADRVENLIQAVGLPTHAKGVNYDDLVRAFSLDKKNRQGAMRWVLPEAIGNVRVVKVTNINEIEDVIRARIN